MSARPPTGTLTARPWSWPLAGAVRVLGYDHRATKALAKASLTMAKADLWKARLAVKTLRRDQREAIAETVEAAWEAEGV